MFSLEPKYPPKVPYVGPIRVSKISFTVTAIPSATDPTETVALLARFLIRDSAINPGLFFNDVTNNARDRLDNIKRGGKTKFHEKFVNYEALYYTHHPAGKSTSRETYAECVRKLHPEIIQDHHGGKMASYIRDLDYVGDSPSNVFNLFSIERALNKLVELGGDPAVIRNPHAWMERSTGTARFPPRAKARTFKYPSEQAFWHHPDEVGLKEQYFPHVDASRDFLTRLVSGADMEDFFANGEEFDPTPENAAAAVGNAISDVQRILENNMRFSREQLMLTQLVSYDTNNEFVHKAAEARVIYEKLAQYFPPHSLDTLDECTELRKKFPLTWRNKLSVKQKKRVDKYELYCATLSKTQESLMQIFLSLFQLQGDIKNIAISKVMRIMLMWYRDNHEQLMPHMSREFITYDPRLDPFGNTMLQQLDIYVRYGRILHPIICLLSEGLFSCYDQFKQLCFNMLLHGRFDSGKTHTAIRALVDFSTIPHTATECSLATDAADTTANHVYDEIEGK